MQKSTKINEKFNEFVHCLQELLDFEKFYYRFGQLIQEWRHVLAP